MSNHELTNNDLEIMLWINKFGFVELSHIQQQFSKSCPSLDNRIESLLNSKYILFEKIFHEKEGVYHVSLQGTRASNDKIRPLKKINLATYTHHLQLVDLYFILSKQETATFITEREIRYLRGKIGIGLKGHISDGALQFKYKYVAIELELSSKGIKRRREIINYYLKHIEFDELWYICSSERIIRELSPHTNKMPFVKLILFSDLAENHEISLSPI